VKGGEAYGKRALGESPAFPGMLYCKRFACGAAGPESELAARLVPERLTFC
jgi:hypothetical protein